MHDTSDILIPTSDCSPKGFQLANAGNVSPGGDCLRCILTATSLTIVFNSEVFFLSYRTVMHKQRHITSHQHSQSG